MVYNKIGWVDRKTVVNASRLNNMDDGIYNAHLEIEAIQGKIEEINLNQETTTELFEQINNERGYVNTKILHDGADYNSVTKNGKYRIYQGVNAPILGDYMFTIDVTIEDETHISQIASLVNGGEKALYYRACIRGVWSNWSKVAIDKDIESIQTEIGTIQNEATALKERVSTNETDIDSLEQRATTNEADITTLKGESTSLKGRVLTNETEIVNIKGSITSIEGDIDTIQEAIGTSGGSSGGSLLDRVSTAEQDIEALEQKATTNETAIATLGQENTSVKERVSTLESNMSTVQGKVGTLENSVSTIEGNVSTINGEVSTVKGRVDTLESNVTTISGNVSTIGNKVSTLENDMTTVEGNVSTIDSDLKAHKTDTNAHADIRSQIGSVGQLLTVSKEVVGAINELYLGGTSVRTMAKVSGSDRVLRVTADTTTNVFDVGIAYNSEKVELYLMGLRIFDGKDYTINGTVITLESTLLPGEYLDILSMDEVLVDLGNNVIVETHKRYVAEVATSTFTVEGNLNYGYLDIYQMGVRLYEDFDYTVDRLTNVVTLVQPLEIGEYVDYTIRSNEGTNITEIKESLQQISEIDSKVQGLETTIGEVNTRVDSSVKNVEASTNYNTIKVTKNDGTVEYVEIKTLGGVGNSINLFKSGTVEESYTATIDNTTSFSIPFALTNNSFVELFFKNLRLIKGVDYTLTINELDGTNSIELSFALKQGETIYYTVEHTSYDYNDLNNLPDLSLKADKTEVDAINSKLPSGTIATTDITTSLDDKKADKSYVDTQDKTLSDKINDCSDDIENLFNISKVQHISSGTHTLSDYNKKGIYSFGTSCTITDIPEGVNGWLIVIPMGREDLDLKGQCKQIWMRWGTPTTNSWMTYERLVGATIGEWTLYATTTKTEILSSQMLNGWGIRGNCYLKKSGEIYSLNGQFVWTSDSILTNGVELFVLTDGLRPSVDIEITGAVNAIVPSERYNVILKIYKTGSVKLWHAGACTSDKPSYITVCSSY